MKKLIKIIVFFTLISFSCNFKEKRVRYLLTHNKAKYWTLLQPYSENGTIRYDDNENFYFFDNKDVWRSLMFFPKDTSWYLGDSYPADVIPCNEYSLINDSILTLCRREYLIKYISEDSLVISSKVSKKIEIFRAIKGIPHRKNLKRLHNYQIIEQKKN